MTIVMTSGAAEVRIVGTLEERAVYDHHYGIRGSGSADCGYSCRESSL